MPSNFMGYPINVNQLSELIRSSVEKIQSNEQSDNWVFSCANPHSLAVANEQHEFRLALSNANILVTDGVGLSFIGRLLGSNVGPRITGSDFFYSLMAASNDSSKEIHLSKIKKIRVCFFGSSEKVLILMQEKLSKIYHNLDLCGFISPPYGEWSDTQNQQFIDNINALNPDLLWVGMTAPKQELWTFKNRHLLNAKVIGNIGAVFDFCAGTYERAPVLAQKLGIEWLVRLCKEPKRMWKRNLVSPVIFTIAAVRWKIFSH